VRPGSNPVESTAMWLGGKAMRRSSSASNKLGSRRRKEAEAQLTRNGTSPYVGAYSLSAIQSACEICGFVGVGPAERAILGINFRIAVSRS